MLASLIVVVKITRLVRSVHADSVWCAYAQDASFGVRDELVRQGILSSITVKGSFDSNLRF
jgi:hypothetical protein